MKNLTAIISLILVISTCKASACNFSAVNVSTGKVRSLLDLLHADTARIQIIEIKRCNRNEE